MVLPESRGGDPLYPVRGDKWSVWIESASLTALNSVVPA